MLYNVTQIKKDIHWLMEQIKCLVKKQDDAATINQNNVFKSIAIATTEEVSEIVVANYINGLTSFMISEIELLIITITKVTVEHSITYKYLLTNTGKGTYGQGGFQINNTHLTLIYEKELIATDIEDLDETQVITLGFVAIDVSTTLNNYAPPITIQNQADGYVLFKTSEGNYLFLAEGGVYGDGQLQTTMADFQLLAEDVLPITNTSQLINDGATGVSVYTEKTYVDALIAAEALARSNADNTEASSRANADTALSVAIVGKEDKTNKTATVIGNEASTTLYLSIVGAVAYFQQKLTDTLFGAFITSLTAKATIVDADTSPISDSEDGGKAKKVTWLNVFSYIKSKSETEISYACSDEVSDLTVGTLITFRMPFGMTLTNLKLSLNTAPTGNKLIVDIRKGGVTILSTLISVNISSTTSVGAAVPYVISVPSLTDDSIITILTTQVGSTVAGKGLKVTFLGKRI
jgi:hypothetical protein